MPLPEDLGVYAVSAAPYLNGMGEAAEELRRRMLDLLRAGDLEDAEATLKLMVEIYDLLTGLEYPDAMAVACLGPPTWPAHSSSGAERT